MNLKFYRDIRISGPVTLSGYEALFTLWVTTNEAGKLTIGEDAAFNNECREWLKKLNIEKCNAIHDKVIDSLKNKVSA